LGRSTEAALYKFSSVESLTLIYKINSLTGRDLLESSLRIKSELLKASSANPTIKNLEGLVSLLSNETAIRYNVASTFQEYFSKFRISETTRRMLSVNRTLPLPDTPVIRAQITSADVIHS